VLKIRDPLDAPHEQLFNDRAMQLLASTCPGLVELHLEGCHYASDYGMFSIMEKCKKLEVIKFWSCNCFSGIALSGLRGTSTSALQVVEICGSNGLCEKGVRSLAVAAPGLRELVLQVDSRHKDLDAALSILAERCPNLVKLTLSNCKILDRTVSHFAECCKGLVSVSFACEPSLTDSGVRSLMATLPGLKQLELWHCPQLRGATGSNRLTTRRGQGDPASSSAMSCVCPLF
jgi:hypothetical protein